MINNHEANVIANRYLRELEQQVGESLALLLDDTLETEAGWVFFYNTVEFIETGDFISCLAGNSPFIVEKNVGAIHELGTGKPVEESLKDFEKVWSKGS